MRPTESISTVRNPEILGEAAAHVPDEFRASTPELEWPRVVGLRNRVVRGQKRPRRDRAADEIRKHGGRPRRYGRIGLTLQDRRRQNECE
jgi:hypothetical protein